MGNILLVDIWIHAINKKKTWNYNIKIIIWNNCIILQQINVLMYQINVSNQMKNVKIQMEDLFVYANMDTSGKTVIVLISKPELNKS
jgi:hypothetical protein